MVKEEDGEMGLWWGEYSATVKRPVWGFSVIVNLPACMLCGDGMALLSSVGWWLVGGGVVVVEACDGLGEVDDANDDDAAADDDEEDGCGDPFAVEVIVGVGSHGCGGGSCGILLLVLLAVNVNCVGLRGVRWVGRP